MIGLVVATADVDQRLTGNSNAVTHAAVSQCVPARRLTNADADKRLIELWRLRGHYCLSACRLAKALGRAGHVGSQPAGGKDERRKAGPQTSTGRGV